jgi:hypothetical protein
VPHSPYSKYLTLGKSATYRIGIEGRLDKNWGQRLAGMDITVSNREDNTEVTTLSGRVRDQAELMGVLNSLYQFHMPLLFVEILNDEPL